jgi:hypothetical protein
MDIKEAAVIGSTAASFFTLFWVRLLSIDKKTARLTSYPHL